MEEEGAGIISGWGERIVGLMMFDMSSVVLVSSWLPCTTDSTAASVILRTCSMRRSKMGFLGEN